MSFKQFTKLFFLALSGIFMSVASPATSIQAQVLELDFSRIIIDDDGVEDDGISTINALRYVEAVERGKAFWDARILGYSNKLPQEVQAQLSGDLVIFVGNTNLGGNILGQAGLVQMSIINVVTGNMFNQRPVVLGQEANFTLDNNFIANNTTDELTDVAIHEFAHALGLGSLWEDNGLLSRRRVGPLQYIGENARRAFAIEAGVAGLARTGFVPIEQQGGPGTALGHWDDDSPTFNSIPVNGRIELMTGFLVPNTQRFISRTTLAQFVDLNYVVKGFNEDELIPFPGLNRPVIGSNGVIFTPPVDPDEEVADDGAVNQSGAANQPRKTLNVYKKRRR